MAYIQEVKYFNCFLLKGSLSGDKYHIEEARIKGGYNDPSVDFGVRAHIVDNNYAQQQRTNTLIYSGIYNNKTGVNDTNQFPIDKPITVSVDIQQGSIQKLFAENEQLNIFQEEKVRYIKIDKDVIYTAEGIPLSTTSNVFLGDVQAYATNYGIGKNPESFAYYAGRKYFVDRPKGAVLRLSLDGITEISNYGMRGYFRDVLRGATKVVGIWDMYNKDYVVSIQGGLKDVTLSFDEATNGWVSRYDYIPQAGGSLDGKFYTFSPYVYNEDAEVVISNPCDIWEHYSNSTHNNFYDSQYTSQVSMIFNQNPSASKNFLTINYEGSKTWNIDTIRAEQDTDIQDSAKDIIQYNAANEDLIISGFKLYDGKFYANLINDSSAKSNEVVFGNSISGIKGYFATFNIKTSATTYQELFSVSTNYNINSY